jgi:hypothetical protein
MTERDAIVRLGGLCFLLFIPVLVTGSILFAQIGVSSRSDGADALRRIAEAGGSFPVMNGLFHLGALLLLPGAAALVVLLRGTYGDGWIVLGTLFLGLAVAIPAGIVFALNQGLFAIALPFRGASLDTQAAYSAAADLDLGIQAGAELVQSLGAGLWVACVGVTIAAAGWPTWLAWLGLASGLGFVSAGLSSVLLDVPVLGPVLAAAGFLGLVVFAVWLLAVGTRLMTTPLG